MMCRALATGLTSSTWKCAVDSASRKAASISSLLAMRGARSVATVRRSEKVETETTVRMRASLAAA